LLNPPSGDIIMRSIILGFFIAAALGASTLGATILGATTASALDRSGSTTIDIDGRKIVQTFKTSFDPVDGTFRTSGIVTLPNGREGAYALSGTCHKETRSCDLSGNGVGPFGNKWNGTGLARRSGDKTTVTAILIGPGGRTIKINREVQGEGIFPSDF
jgi:hypothetical protein